MIYFRLHQARSEEIEPGANREISLQERENFATVAKFRYVVNFATCRKFRYIENFRYCSEISLCSEIPPVVKFPVPCFYVQTTHFWLISFLPSL